MKLPFGVPCFLDASHIEGNIKTAQNDDKKGINNTPIEKLSYYWYGVQFGFFAIFVLVFVHFLF